MTKRGFTLIELLIVIAILGTLATVVLIAIDPQERLAQTRDAGRISAIKQLSTALDSYSVSNGGIPPTYNASWMQELVDSGEISTLISEISSSKNSCSLYAPVNGWCYHYRPTLSAWGYTVYTALESDNYLAKCKVIMPSATVAYAMYASFPGRMFLVCRPDAWEPYTLGPPTYPEGWAAAAYSYMMTDL